MNYKTGTDAMTMPTLQARSRCQNFERGRRWSKAMDADFLKLSGEGLSAGQIAKAMGVVSRNAVIGRLHRLKHMGVAVPPPAYRAPLAAMKARKAANAMPDAQNADRRQDAPYPREYEDNAFRANLRETEAQGSAQDRAQHLACYHLGGRFYHGSAEASGASSRLSAVEERNLRLEMELGKLRDSIGDIRECSAKAETTMRTFVETTRFESKLDRLLAEKDQVRTFGPRRK